MNTDERFDGLLRAALTWQADEAVRAAPRLERSVDVVAARIGPGAGRRPVLVSGPGSSRGLQLAFVALLLLVLLAAVLAIGSFLVPRAGLEPPRFGYATRCLTPPDDTMVYGVFGDVDPPLVLNADGLLWQMESNLGETRTAMFEGIVGIERRMTERGIELVRQRIAETLPDPGCRALRSSGEIGQIAALVAGQHVELSWHPQNPGRRLTADEEAAAEALEEALLHPEVWLPADAWIEPGEQRATPERWLTIVEVTPSGFGPGEEVPLSTGAMLEGSDPRYERVVLPGGVAPAEFGAEVAQRDGTAVRCGVLPTSDALALASSLDELPLAMHDEEELFTTDLTARVFIYIATAYPQEPDCGRFGEQTTAAFEPTPLPSISPGPDDDLATVDPCGLIPPSIDERFAGTESREEQPGEVGLGIPARTCWLLSHEDGNVVPKHRLAVTVYPRSVDDATAEVLAEAVLGGGFVEEAVPSGRLWLNDCFAGAVDCRRIATAWSAPAFVVVEFSGGPGGPEIPPATARSVAAEIVEALPGQVIIR